MKKYWAIIRNEVQRQFTYRASIASFSLGNILEVVSQVIIWTVIYQGIGSVKGYNYAEMMSYVIVGWFFLFITSNYNFEAYIARDIHQGTLSNLIVKPISYLRYAVTVSCGRIVVAFSMVLVQAIIVFSFFHSKITLPENKWILVILFLMAILGYFIKLFISVLIGLIAFWTTEISGIYFSLNVVAKFLAGAYFPINLLSSVFVNVSLAFPFAYTFYVPIQLYLGRLDFKQGIISLGIQLIWLFFLYGIIKMVWHFGIKKYESVGI